MHTSTRPIEASEESPSQGFLRSYTAAGLRSACREPPDGLADFGRTFCPREASQRRTMLLVQNKGVSNPPFGAGDRTVLYALQITTAGVMTAVGTIVARSRRDRPAVQTLGAGDSPEPAAERDLRVLVRAQRVPAVVVKKACSYPTKYVPFFSFLLFFPSSRRLAHGDTCK
jgi:hypothetical protein